MTCPITAPVRILCVDEDSEFLSLIKAGLEAQGFEVTVAYPGIDAVMQYRGSAGKFYAVIARAEFPASGTDMTFKCQRAPPGSIDEPEVSGMPLKSSIKALAATAGS